MYIQYMIWGVCITNKRKFIAVILLTVATAVLTACVLYYLMDYLRYRATQKIGNEAQITISDLSGEDTTSAFQHPAIDFEKLQKVNGDVYAWIRIPDQDKPGSYIANYPILQRPVGKSQDYYLKRNVNFQYSSYGSIYTQSINAKDFSDFNTVIYGHNMRNGTMFGSLRKYRDSDFFRDNNEILVYTPGRTLKYRIFAAYVYDDRHILTSFNNDNPLDRERYLDEIFTKRKLTSNIDRTVDIGPDDHIITLSTCTARDGERYLVQGVLVYDSITDSQ